MRKGLLCFSPRFAELPPPGDKVSSIQDLASVSKLTFLFHLAFDSFLFFPLISHGCPVGMLYFLKKKYNYFILFYSKINYNIIIILIIVLYCLKCFLMGGESVGLNFLMNK